MLGGIERLGIDLERARVRHGELELELRLSRTEREIDRVAPLLSLRLGLGPIGCPLGARACTWSSFAPAGR